MKSEPLTNRKNWYPEARLQQKNEARPASCLAIFGRKTRDREELKCM